MKRLILAALAGLSFGAHASSVFFGSLPDGNYDVSKPMASLEFDASQFIAVDPYDPYPSCDGTTCDLLLYGNFFGPQGAEGPIRFSMGLEPIKPLEYLKFMLPLDVVEPSGSAGPFEEFYRQGTALIGTIAITDTKTGVVLAAQSYDGVSSYQQLTWSGRTLNPLRIDVNMHLQLGYKTTIGGERRYDDVEPHWWIHTQYADVPPVPEPAQYAMMLAGLALLAGVSKSARSRFAR